MRAFAETGQGVVIMINANDNSTMMQRILAAIGRQYHWPDAGRAGQITQARRIKVDAPTLERYAGRYEIGNNRMITLQRRKTVAWYACSTACRRRIHSRGRLTFQSDSRDTALVDPLDAARRRHRRRAHSRRQGTADYRASVR